MIRLMGGGGAYVEMLEYGATVVSVWIPDREKRLRDVVLGYGSEQEYRGNDAFLGATIGRNINRIANASFELNGKKYMLAATENAHQLHGGAVGFDKRMWSCAEGESSAVFSLVSKDGDEGFPGELSVSVTYSFSSDNELAIDYFARASEDTVCNLSSHCYFNLNGQDSGTDIKGHSLQIFADRVTENGFSNIPTGRFIDVVGTAFDFRKLKNVGAALEAPHENMAEFLGFDHNFALNGHGFRRAAVLESAESGIRLEVSTDMPGVQLYTANYLTKRAGKAGAEYGKYSGLCLETQYFPNSINQPLFDPPILRRGETYLHRTVYKFSAF